ncbi:glycosyltransferase family 4 protein [[Clostridium] fimetarium]|uniref:Glycosyltransferase involved in cell wall bisynthesis n=1 Tax=[Clostridium] fimetarium TaxID=99656 RepID=A0A1I0P3Y0_9FIRM|nr:glycosyltransferase family 4 protein [[Clostridium] fimetarium]SEW09059.1 Glycosyltransferase involved in cell wall bisynthesis [[Clostridium] fimetarium]
MEKLQYNNRLGIYNFCPYIAYRNEQIMKDPCLVPYVFHQIFGYRAVIVTAKREEYIYQKLVSGLEFDILPDQPDLQAWENLCCEYIKDNYEKIDIMFCFGIYTTYSSMIQTFKKYKPHGKVILKLDANIYWVNRIDFQDSVYRNILENSDIITCESHRLKKYLSIKWPYRIDYLPNGFIHNNINSEIEYGQKENHIITVGRIGTPQKANEILLEGFARCANQIPSWELRLVGSVEDSFQPYLTEYFDKYPHLRNRVIFTGKILDKELLYNEYKKAKIFVITSRYEGGMPNVWAEAAQSGCYIITSDIEASNDAINNGSCGIKFPIDNIQALADCLVKVCSDENCMKDASYEIQQYVSRFFDYKMGVKKLLELLKMRS